MTEMEKMLAGQWYAANDNALAAARERAKATCHACNLLAPNQPDARSRLLRDLLGSVADDFKIEPVFFCDYGFNIAIGRNFYSNHNCVILDCGRVTFGDNVFIGPNCGFYTVEHPLDAAIRRQGLERARPITIGDDVWFGGNVVVLPGVSVGEGTVIGAGSVVTRSIPAGVVAAGNPCRVLHGIAPSDEKKGCA